MARYSIGGTITVSVFVEIEANSPEEALRKAEEGEDCGGVQGLCHQCSGGSSYRNQLGMWRLSDGLDGEPVPIPESVTET